MGRPQWPYSLRRLFARRRAWPWPGAVLRVFRCCFGPMQPMHVQWLYVKLGYTGIPPKELFFSIGKVMKIHWNLGQRVFRQNQTVCKTKQWIDDDWICIWQIGTGWKSIWIEHDQKTCYQSAVWDKVMKVFSCACTSAVWVACKHVCINLAGSFGHNQAGSWKLRLAAWLPWFQKARSRYRQGSKVQHK